MPLFNTLRATYIEHFCQYFHVHDFIINEFIFLFYNITIHVVVVVVNGGHDEMATTTTWNNVYMKIRIIIMNRNRRNRWRINRNWNRRRSSTIYTLLFTKLSRTIISFTNQHSHYEFLCIDFHDISSSSTFVSLVSVFVLSNYSLPYWTKNQLTGL